MIDAVFGDRLLPSGTFVGQNNLSVDVLIHAPAITRCMIVVVDRHSAASPVTVDARSVVTVDHT